MAEIPEIQLHIRGAEEQTSYKDALATSKPASSLVLKEWKWWLIVIINIFFLLAGQTIATLLGRFYYDKGGNSKWMATLVQSAGFPILLIPLFLFPSTQNPTPPSTTTHPPATKIALIYAGIGLIVAGDNLMYSYGLLYLPVSTYSLICATQLAFNAIFSYFLNSQKFTPLILNSIVLLTFSAALLAVQSDDTTSSSISRAKYALGFTLTVGASATYSFYLSIVQLAFEKVIKSETFTTVLELQIGTSAVAACATVVGLFASGEWKELSGEMEGFEKGRAGYVMTLVGTAVAWQVASVGIVGLVFVVTSLFSNVISTLALPVVPVFAVVFFGDRMEGVKVMAMLIAVWGFVSYIYQHYLDDSKANKGVKRGVLE